MEALQIEKESAIVRLTERDVLLLANVINEAQEAIESWEFSTRVGADPAEAEALRGALRELLASMRRDR
jgi:hypothetical protein